MTTYTSQQLEHYWRFYSEIFMRIEREPDPQKIAENEKIVRVIGEQYQAMDEETQGAFNMAMLASKDEDEAEHFPLSTEQLDSDKSRVLKETAQLLEK